MQFLLLLQIRSEDSLTMPTELRNEDELASSEEEDGGETEEMSPKKSERRKLRTKVTLEQGEEEENGSGRMEAGERRVLIMEGTPYKSAISSWVPFMLFLSP